MWGAGLRCFRYASVPLPFGSGFAWQAQEGRIVNQSGRGLAYAALAGVTVWIMAGIWPTFDANVPRIYIGALALGGIAAGAFVAGYFTNNTAFQAAVTSSAIGSASLAIVGLAAIEVAPVNGKANEALQAGALIAVLVVGVAFLFSDSAPQISWSKLPVVTTIAAIVLVIAYAATIVYMLTNANVTAVTELVWARYLVVFTAVQGVGLAAVGALLGSQAKQGEVLAAQSDAKDATALADRLKNTAPVDPNATPTAADADDVAAMLRRLDALKVRYLR